MWTSIARSGFASSSAHDLSVTAGTPIAALKEVFLHGEGSVAVATRHQVRRDNSNGGTPTAITQTKLNPRSVAPTLTGASAFASVPALGGVILQCGIQQFGGLYRWYAGPGEEVFFTGAVPDNELSLSDALNRAATLSGHFICEEM